MVAYDAHKKMTSSMSYQIADRESLEPPKEDFLKMEEDAANIIRKLNPALTNINPIFVPEFPLGSSFKDVSDAERSLAEICLKAGGGTDAAVTNSWFYVLFGFAASIDVPGSGPVNLLIYRGTATRREALVDITGWGSTEACMLPTTQKPQARYGNVQSTLFSFYKDAFGLGLGTPLSKSTTDAVKNVVNSSPSSTPWFAGAHSLGGAALNLAILDILAAKILETSEILPLTFGGLVVGDDDFKTAYEATSTNSVRIVNMCDFVPAFCDIFQQDSPTVYAQVGTPMGFVWQNEETWKNHSMKDIYLRMVVSSDYFKLIRVFPNTFPVSLYLVLLLNRLSKSIFISL
jgi:hypothetical protein